MTRPDIASMTAEEVNRHICRLRGWTKATYHSAEAWEPALGSWDRANLPWGSDGTPIYWLDGMEPPWCSEWAFAGPLIDEVPSIFWILADMARQLHAAGGINAPAFILGEPPMRLTETASRAWLAANWGEG